MKIKRKHTKKGNITSFNNGGVSYQFKGKGPFEIEDSHYPYLADYFDIVEEKKPSLPEPKEVTHG